MVSCKVWNYCTHGNTILRHSSQRLSSSEVPIAKKRRSWKEKPLSATERLWSFYCWLSISQDHSWNSWQCSRDLVSVLRSIVYTASITQFAWSPLFPRIMSLMQCNLIGLPTFQHVEWEWNRLFTRQFSPPWWKMVKEFLLSSSLPVEYTATWSCIITALGEYVIITIESVDSICRDSADILVLVQTG